MRNRNSSVAKNRTYLVCYTCCIKRGLVADLRLMSSGGRTSWQDEPSLVRTEKTCPLSRHTTSSAPSTPLRLHSTEKMMLVRVLYSSSSGVCCNKTVSKTTKTIFQFQKCKPINPSYLWIGCIGDCVSGRVFAIAAIIQYVGQAGALPGSERWEGFAVF